MSSTTTKDDVNCTPLTSFDRMFPLLHPELRQYIFDLTRFHYPPRMIHYDARKIWGSSLPVTLLPCQSKGRLPRQNKDTTDQHKYTMTPRDPDLRRLPPCFHVCHAARQQCYRTFTWLRNGVWFDCGRETLFMYDASHPEAILPEFELLPPPPPEWDDGKKNCRELDIGRLKYIIMDEATLERFITNQGGPGWQDLFGVLMKRLIEVQIIRAPKLQEPSWGPPMLAIPMPIERKDMFVTGAVIRSTGNQLWVNRLTGAYW
ncbi:uncharacterized protein Bfra_007494 [Botrytis fragariae]|uniref:2EXR domain-containing protein n=1 Tax=Botrytis fragariae TaxID=1964551 RepID=A0A8H6AIL2_9HELO|nr:uncharacterized protein Bfra_007494 [Botrytis fragariae]KAF5868297.1 hypothetical protein Bfra_007494 [Botrytis fragariae]